MRQGLNNTFQPIYIFGCFLFLLALTACSQNPVTGKSNLSLITEQQEINIGRKGHVDVLKRYPLYANEDLQNYIDRIGQKLARNSHRSNLIYRFTLLDSKDINAFALPGGYIYITRGLLAYLNSEAELAAVLGHEIGHVTARHSVRQISAAKATQFGYQLGALFLPAMRTQQASQLFGLLGNALIQGYGREHELEADRLGAEYLLRSGYPPSAMIEVIKILKNQEIFERQLAQEEHRKPNIYHGVFSTHPDNDTRLNNVIASVGDSSTQLLYQTRTNDIDNPSQDRFFLRRLEGLIFGDSEAQGILRGNRFYHKNMLFSLTLPPLWTIKNRTNGLIAKAPDGKAKLWVTVEDLNLRIPPEEFIRQRLKISSMQVNRPLLINNLPAYTLQTVSENGKFRRISVIYYRNQAFIIMGGADTAQNLVKYDDEFMRTAYSFHALRKEERELATAKTLHLVENQGHLSLNDFIAQSSPFPHHAKEQLELLNNLYPNKQPKRGWLIKIVH